MAHLPLENITIIDLTMVWAGPFCTRLLADMGARIIKIESISRIDSVRGATKPRPGSGAYRDNDPGEHPWNRAAYFNKVNRNKLGITLDLNSDKGKEIFLNLVKIGDAVTENFSARVMGNFGLTYDKLCQVKPDIVMISMPGFGMTGPWRDFISYGVTMEGMSGMSSLIGYEGGPPMIQSESYGDPIGGLNAAIAILAALEHRRKTGKGQFIDLSQLETSIPLIGEYILDYTMNGRSATRHGNSHPSMAPHGVYRCKGDDKWVAIAVRSDDEWPVFCNAIGKPQLGTDPNYSDLVSRLRNKDELDKIVETWTAEREHYEAMNTLQKVGIAAGAVLNAAELVVDPQLSERGFWETVHHPEAGSHKLLGMTARLSKTPGSLRMAAPTLGQHNNYVFKELLGMSDAEVSDLEEQKIIGTMPVM